MRARQTGTLVPSPLKRWMSPSLIERNFQCALPNALAHTLLRMRMQTHAMKSGMGLQPPIQPQLQIEGRTAGEVIAADVQRAVHLQG